MGRINIFEGETLFKIFFREIYIFMTDTSIIMGATDINFLKDICYLLQVTFKQKYLPLSATILLK